ncbi:MAG: zf-HC2 domain-containing protein [Bryobacteraceae bacterium]
MSRTSHNPETCAAIEPLLCELADGRLGGETRHRVEHHLAGCGSCREVYDDARAALSFLGGVDAPELPEGLVNGILNKTIAVREQLGEAPAPRAERTGISAWLAALFEPILQPKLAMGIAMTILSFSMIARMAGIEQKPFTADDLTPSRIVANLDTKIHRLWDRAVKYYENLRLVNQIQDRLDEWSASEEESRRNRRRMEPIQIEEEPKSGGAQ